MAVNVRFNVLLPPSFRFFCSACLKYLEKHSTNRMDYYYFSSLKTVVSTMPVFLPGRLSLKGIGTLQVKTHSSSTLLLTRPNFLRVPLSFTPPWIFNYTDKELGKHLSPCFPLSLHAWQPGWDSSPVQHGSRTCHRALNHTRASAEPRRHTVPCRTHILHTHAQKIKMNFLATYGEEGGWWWWRWRFGWGWGWCRGRRMEGGSERGWAGGRKVVISQLLINIPRLRAFQRNVINWARAWQ